MKKKQRKGNPFWETIHDIRQMTASHLDQNKSKVFKLQNPTKKKYQQKGVKVPLPLLNRIRKKAITTMKQEKELKKTQDIQYDSLLKTKDTKFLDKLKAVKKRSKSTFIKNKYKFKEMRSRQVGQFKNGALQLSERDVTKIKRSK